MNNYTPGPWGELCNIGPLEIGIDYPEGDDRDHYLATVMCGDPDELQANARLIAAAPAMLAALEGALLVIDALMPGAKFIPIQNYALLNDAPLAAHRAIAMAKGEK